MSNDLRARLGRVGVWSGAVARAHADTLREAVPPIEELGYGALWYPEGPETFSRGALLLSCSRDLVVATGIANLYARDPMAMRTGADTLADAFPGRFVLGIGVSHQPAVEPRGHSYSAPVPRMRAYLDAMDAVEPGPFGPPPPAEPPARLLAALGPRMLRLAGERTQGAHPYLTTPGHTALARETLGPEAFLAPEQKVILETDATKAREVARALLGFYFVLDAYHGNALRMGFTEEDLAAPLSDRLIDGLVAWGDADAIRARVKEHLDAGADHVCIQPLVQDGFGLDVLRELAPALTSL